MRDIIGVIGGSGFYSFIKGKEVSMATPYGKPSDKILIGEIEGRRVVFLPRHGKKHHLPPHKINYRANLFAFKKLGVRRVIAPCAVGSLRASIKPGDIVICDQFIDRTKRREDTFFNGPRVAHISAADPYCPQLRGVALRICKKLNLSFHKKGRVVVIEGPRFSTFAESQFYSKIGEVINMTQYPEVILAKELGMCYLNISLVTDYDAGLKGRRDIKAVTAQEVLRVFKENNERVKRLILEIIKNLPSQRSCCCAEIVEKSYVSH